MPNAVRERNRARVLDALDIAYRSVAEIMRACGLTYYPTLRHLRDLQAEGLAEPMDEEQQSWRRVRQ